MSDYNIERREKLFIDWFSIHGKEVVRCKECRWFEKGCTLFDFYSIGMDEMGFCAWGDRKDR